MWIQYTRVIPMLARESCRYARAAHTSLNKFKGKLRISACYFRVKRNNYRTSFSNRNVKLEGRRQHFIEWVGMIIGCIQIFGGEGEMQDFATVNHISFFIAFKIKM